ncbi:MAG: cache domain-containing protein [Pseudomonadota bacterium]|nr:cache domain-containing protein [Pseudomonadota bacterium]
MKNKPSLTTTYLYSMSLTIILFFLLVGYLLVNDEFKNFHKESAETRTHAIESQKTLIKKEVEKLVDYIHYKKSLAEERVRKKVKNRAYEAHQMATYIYKQNSDKPLNVIKTMIHDALFAISWDRGRGYYFAEDMDGTELVNRNNPNLEGINILDIQDSNGTYLVREIIAVARSKKGEGFCSYYWNKPGHPGILVPTISYVRYFQPLDWVIGTGKYLKDEENAVKKETLARIREISKTTSGFSLRFGNWQSRNLLNPTNENQASQSLDPEEIKTVEKLIANARSGGGFINNNRPVAENRSAVSEIIYSQAISDWQWYVGAVIDLQKIEKAIKLSQIRLKKETRKKIIQIALALLFLLICAYSIARVLSLKIKKDIALFDNFFTTAATQASKLNRKDISFVEFNKLAISANTMIEERLKAEQALKESENRFSQVIENAHIPMGITRDNGETEFLNRKFTQTFGYTLDDIPTMDKWWEKAYPDINYRKEVQKTWFSKLDKVTAREPFEPVTQIRNVTCKDGSIREIKFHYTPVGRHGLVTFHDYTDENRAAREKKRLEKELNQAQKMEAIGLLAGGVAHDLNNILSGVTSYPELLLMRLPEDSNLRQPLKTILKSGQRAAEVVSDLLTIARGAANKKESINLHQVINEYLTSPEHEKTLRENPKLTLTTKFGQDLHHIFGSQIHIRKCLMNLIINSAEAIVNEGEIEISTHTLKPDDPLINKLSLTPGEHTILRVKDNGPGISENDIEHIFEPFYSKKIMGKSGSGLGLAVVWNTMQDHDGRVTVQSDGQGSTFNLYFPATREKANPRPNEVPLPEIKGKHEKILVVDDEPLQQEVARLILEELNYKVETVSSGEEAIKWLQTQAADLIILDMIMDPGISGRETFAQIKNLRPQQKAIIASGFSENEEIKEAQKIGAGTFVKKPYSIEELGLAVKQELTGKKEELP